MECNTTAVKTLTVCIIAATLFVTTNYIALRRQSHQDTQNFVTVSHRLAFQRSRNSSEVVARAKVTCNATTQIAFIKTHKTASSTTSSVIQRFGYARGLAFALPKSNHIFNEGQLFSRKLLLQPRPSENKGEYFNVITSHLRYNRAELDKVVPNATYITILRSPVQRFESAFGYYEYARRFNLLDSKNPLQDFMEDPDKHYKKVNGVFRGLLRNGMSFTFGFINNLHDNEPAIHRLIDKLDNELDLVLIADYYDESLVLLKKVLCWQMDDILYIRKGIRHKSKLYKISKSLAKKITQWNKADVMLFNHFNATFWKKVNSYGPDFYKDVDEFRRRLKSFTEDCVDSQNTRNIKNREEALVMKTNASAECKLAFKRDTEFHAILRKEAKEYSDIKMKNASNIIKKSH
ncbi:galactosylceramide sulfotransferase-like [Ptychodera flava]|uniref:galactosylceramide sulfotransferase-like n=1 Tax=Ptychodera flava TaxID=63121 RepID=UPI00396A276A